MADKEPPLTIQTSRHFLSWLHEAGISLGFTTYQTNRLFLIGSKEDGTLSAFERHFERPMGLYATAERLYMNSLWQIWELDDALPAGERYRDYDRMYVPRRAHTTGHLDVHDIALDRDGRIVFVNTLYSCIATVSDRYSFKPLWKPPFISKLAPEDRCHLNGLAMADGAPAYATTVSRSDVATGWRDRRHAGGCVIDVEDDEIVLDSLSMPHSPRVHDGRLWVLNSGAGELGWVDRAKGRFEPVAFCPGYLRGLAFHGNFAIVGLSKQRKEKTFAGLALDDRLRDKDADARCGLWVIDLTSGNVVHWLQLEGVVIELYDVVVIPRTRRPMALGFKSDEIQRLITIETEPRPVFEPLSVPDPASRGEEGKGGPGDRAPPFEKRGPGDRTPPFEKGGPGGISPFAGGEAKRPAAPSPPEYRQANQLAKQGRWAEAIPLFEEVLRQQPDHVNALNNLATVRHRLGEVDAAIECYRRALAVDPASVKALTNLATVLQQRGELAESIRFWQQARRIEPGNADVLNGLGMAHYESGHLPAARECFTAAVRADPRSAQAHNNLAGVFKIEENRAEALRLHERAAQLDPNFFEAQENIGKSYEEEHRIDEAKAAYRKALAIRDEPVLALHAELLCPPVFPSEAALDAYRQRAERIVELFRGRELSLPLGRVQSSRAEPPYDWAYQGRDNRPLKEKYAALFRANFSAREAPRPRRQPPYRIGFVVTPGHEGVFVRCMGGIVDRFDPPSHPSGFSSLARRAYSAASRRCRRASARTGREFAVERLAARVRPRAVRGVPGVHVGEVVVDLADRRPAERAALVEDAEDLDVHRHEQHEHVRRQRRLVAKARQRVHFADRHARLPRQRRRRLPDAVDRIADAGDRAHLHDRQGGIDGCPLRHAPTMHARSPALQGRRADGRPHAIGGAHLVESAEFRG